MKDIWKIFGKGALVTIIVFCFLGILIYLFDPTYRGLISFWPLFPWFVVGIVFSLINAINKTKEKKNK